MQYLYLLKKGMVIIMKNENCVCKNVTCPRHGNCAACQAAHGASKDYPLTSCQRLEAEKKAEENK